MKKIIIEIQGDCEKERAVRLMGEVQWLLRNTQVSRVGVSLTMEDSKDLKIPDFMDTGQPKYRGW